MSFPFPSPPSSEHSHSSSLFEPWHSPSLSHHSPASSICALSDSVDASSWATLQSAMGDIFHKLIREKQELERSNRAWESKCQALEAEVSSLRATIDRHEAPLPSWQAPWSSTTAPSSAHSIPSSPTTSSPSTSSVSVVSLIDPTKPMSKQTPPPCNSHYLVGYCDVPHCKWGHAYQLTESQVEEIRRGAKFHICNALKNNLACEDPSCPYGHFCPRGSACGRSNCVFNDEQHKHPATVPSRIKRRA